MVYLILGGVLPTGVRVMSKTFFANCYLEFSIGDQHEGLVAMISEQGALHIKFQGVPYSKIAGLAGKTVDVLICNKVRVSGHLCKEMTLSGADYRFQFDGLSEEARAVIQKSMQTQRFPAPWERKTERLPGNMPKTPAATYEQPRDAIVSRGDSIYDLRVVDYSRDGFLLEGRGEAFANWHAGERIEFNICTSIENNLRGLAGAIVRITEDFDRELNEGIFRFGVQLASLDEVTRRRYHALIEKAREMEEKAIAQAA